MKLPKHVYFKDTLIDEGPGIVGCTARFKPLDGWSIKYDLADEADKELSSLKHDITRHLKIIAEKDFQIDGLIYNYSEDILCLKEDIDELVNMLEDVKNHWISTDGDIDRLEALINKHGRQ